MVSKLKTSEFADQLVKLREAALPRRLGSLTTVSLPRIPYDVPAPQLTLLQADEPDSVCVDLWSLQLATPGADQQLGVTISARGADLLLGSPEESRRAGARVTFRRVVFERPGFYVVSIRTGSSALDGEARRIVRSNPNPDFLDLYSCSPGAVSVPVAVTLDRVFFVAEHTGRRCIEGAGVVSGFAIRFLGDFVDRDVEGALLLPDVLKARTNGQVDRVAAGSAPGPFTLTDDVALEVGRSNAVAAQRAADERWAAGEETLRRDLRVLDSVVEMAPVRRRVKLTSKLKD